MSNSSCVTCCDGVSTSSASSTNAFALPSPYNYFVIFLLIALSAMFSGLTLGLLGLDKIGLQIVIGGDDPVQAKYAKAILPLRENGNLLLCTLLLGNVAVNALLSILLADMTSGLVGFLASTILIVIFGEIIPQATCSRHALAIGYRLLPVVQVFVYIFFVFTYPLGAALDYALGEDIGTIHTGTELRKMLEIHVQHGAVDDDAGNIVDGALRYKEVKVKEVMTPASETFMLSVNDVLDYKNLSEVFKAGCSRIPVFGRDRNDIVGLIFAKDLLFIDYKDETPIKNVLSLFGRAAQVVWPDQNLQEVLQLFRQGRGHMAIVRDVNNQGQGDPFYEFLGIITLEDIIEEILGHDIMDETECFVDDNNVVTEVSSRDRDFARLKLLHGKLNDSCLTFDEVKAIASHLTSNVAGFDKVLHACNPHLGDHQFTQTELQEVIVRSELVEHERVTTQDMLSSKTPAHEDLLYQRGVQSTECTLVLSGKVMVLAGKDQFRSELGPWSLLGSDCLADEIGFVPDYTAFVSSENARLLKIRRSNLTIPERVASSMTLAEMDNMKKLGWGKRTNSKLVGNRTRLSSNGSNKSVSDSISGDVELLSARRTNSFDQHVEIEFPSSPNGRSLMGSPEGLRTVKETDTMDPDIEMGQIQNRADDK